MEIVSKRARKQDGEKDSFVVFRDKSYIGWEDLFIGSQSDLPISSLIYELIRVLITILMMTYVYKIPNESIHCKTLNQNGFIYDAGSGVASFISKTFRL